MGRGDNSDLPFTEAETEVLVKDSFQITGRGRVLIARVLHGKISSGDQLTAYLADGSETAITVDSVEVLGGQPIHSASAGREVALTVSPDLDTRISQLKAS